MLAVGLYPDVIGRRAVDGRRIPVAGRIPPALRLLVSEGRDDVQRALRARRRYTPEL